MCDIPLLGYSFGSLSISMLIPIETSHLLGRIKNSGSRYGWRDKLKITHRILGWLALFGFSLIAIVNVYSPGLSPTIIEQIQALHAPLLAICALANLRSMLFVQNKRFSEQRCWIILRIACLTFGSMFTIVASVMLVRGHSGLDTLLLIAHIGLAFLIIFTERMALGRYGDFIDKHNRPINFYKTRTGVYIPDPKTDSKELS